MKKLSQNPTAIASKKWRDNHKETHREVIMRYNKTHDTLAHQRKYDQKMSPYKKQVRILLKILKNLY